MTKFSGRQARPNVSSPMRTTGVRGTTYEGGLGFERDAKTELFLLAVTNMVAEDTFYESGKDRDLRFKELAHKVTDKDPGWIRSFIPYLRNVMQMRSASIVLAAHYVHAKGEKARGVVDSAMSRADEPAEILAYWSQEYGKNFPQPLKRGVADAVERLYTEYSALRYDGQSRAWRMGDVIDLVHPKPLTAEKSALYKYLLDTRHKREDIGTPSEIPMIRALKFANDIPVEARRESMLKNGIPQGMSWESLSGWLQGPMDAEAWENIIPQMGYMALLRNLRNFDEANISKESQNYIRSKLTNPEEVAKSRQFPIRFYSAWKATQSLSYAREIEEALDLSVKNIPTLDGRTLILVDVSGSMWAPISSRSTVQRYELAALFGSALALRNRGSSDLVWFSTNSSKIWPAHSVLKTIDKIVGNGGGGTATWQAVDTHYNHHDRIVIITDEQARASYGARREYGVPIYTFNLAGYKMAHNEQGEKGSYVFGGLTDAGFVLLKALDTLQTGVWPWDVDSHDVTV